MMRRIRALHADTRGVTLPEVLVGTLIGALIMGVVATTIFTTNDLRQHADDRSQFAAELSVTSLSFDRDGVMADVAAPGAPFSSPSCAAASPIDFGAVQYRTVSGRLERVSGAVTRTMLRNVSSCTWQAVRIGAGRYTILVNLSLLGPSGETLTQILRVAPRSW